MNSRPAIRRRYVDMVQVTMYLPGFSSTAHETAPRAIDRLILGILGKGSVELVVRSHLGIPHGAAVWRRLLREVCLPFLRPYPILAAVMDGDIPSRPSVAVHRWSYAYCTLHRARTETFTWLFAGLMGAAAWRPVRRASTSISGSLLEQIIVPGCAASQRTGKVWRYQRGFSMRSIERQTFQQSNDWFPAFEETYGDRFG